MKKIIYLLLLISTFAHSQISDTDAKILYQQAEDAYNNGRPWESWKITKDLHSQMNKWTPKVLFLQIKSDYIMSKNKDENYINPDGYSNAKEFIALCDTLNNKIINYKDYPIEKKMEIKEMETFFNKLKEKYEYQKDRTPEKAIAFLNECSKLFSGCLDNNPIYPAEIKFVLDKNNLRIISTNLSTDENDYGYHGRVDIIDLSKLSKYRVPIWSLTDHKLEIVKIYNIFYKVNDFCYKKYETQYIPRRPKRKDMDLHTKWLNEYNDELNGITNKTPFQKNTENYDFLDYFNKRSDEYISGNYENRIRAVMYYLSSCFESEDVIEKKEIKKNGF